MNQIVGIVGMLLSFVVGGFLVLKDRTLESLWAGMAAFAFLLVAVVDWQGIFSNMGRKLSREKTDDLEKKNSPKKAARRAAPSARASAAPEVAGPSLAERFTQWTGPKEISVSWGSYLATALVVLGLGQVLIFVAERYFFGWLLTAVAVLLIGQFALAKEDRFRMQVVGTFPALVASLALGLVLEAIGFFVSYHGHPYIGFFAIVLASVAIIYGIWWRLELPLRMNGEPMLGLRAFAPLEGWSAQSWAFKGACLLLFTFAFVASAFLSSFEQVVIARTIGLAALMLSFPWGSSDLRLIPNLAVPTRRALALGFLGLALILGHRGQSLVYQGNFTPGLLFFLVATVLWIAAAPGPDAEADNGGPTRVEIGLFIALIAVGGLMRVYHIGSMPLGVEGDEAGYGIWGDDLLHMRVEQIFIHYAQSLYWYWGDAPMLKIFGITPTGVRMHSVFHGTLSLATFYLFMRLFFNWRTAFAAACLMCVSHWHLHFSRFGHFNVTQGFSQALFFYFLFRAARRRSLLDFVLAGVGLSIACQAHVAARLIPVFLTVFLGYLFFVHRKVFMQLLPGIIIVVVSSWILLSGPWIQYARQPNLAFARVKEVSIVNEENSNAPSDVMNGFFTSAKASILMFNFRGDSRPRDNWLAPEPMLDHWTAILWVFGFGLCLYRWRKPLYGFTLIAFLGTLMASAMSVEAPQSLRTAGNITFVFMMVGMAIEQVRWTVEEALGRAGKFVFAALMAVAVLVIGDLNISAYLQRSSVQALDALPTMIGLAAQNLGPGGRVEFQSEWFGWGHPPVQLFSQGIPDVSYGDISTMLPTEELPAKGIYFAFSDRYKPNIDYVKQLYPQGEARNIPDPQSPGGPNYYDGWFVSGQQLQQAHGLKATYTGSGHTQQLIDNVLVGDAKVPDWARSAEWDGSFLADTDTHCKMYIKGGSGSAELWVDGTRVSGSRGATTDARTVRISGGLHRLKVRWQGSGQPGRLVWERSNVGHMATGYYELKPGQEGLSPVDASSLFNDFKPTGLLLQFRTGTSLSGGIPMMKVDPTLDSYWLSAGYGPISLKWTGMLIVTEAGHYSFRVADAPSASVKVNGRALFSSGALAWHGSAPKGPNQTLQLELPKGRYPIEVDYQSPGAINYSLQWSLATAGAGGHSWENIPSAALEPEVHLGD